MSPVELYNLRMGLLNAGYVPIPCRDGRPVVILQAAPTEGAIRGWATAYPRAIETGIVVGDRVIVVGSLEDAMTATTPVKECARSEPSPSPSSRSSSTGRRRQPRTEPETASRLFPGGLSSRRSQALEGCNRGGQGSRHSDDHLASGQERTRDRRRSGKVERLEGGIRGCGGCRIRVRLSQMIIAREE